MNSDRMSMRHTLAAHALTAGVTLLAVAVLFGGRLGLMRQPPVAQIPVLSQEPEPPSPVPRAPGFPRIHAGGSDS